MTVLTRGHFFTSMEATPELPEHPSDVSVERNMPMLRGCHPRRRTIWVLLPLLLITLSACQSTGYKVTSTGPWAGLSSEEPTVRITTIHAIQRSVDRNNVPLLFPLLNDSDRWVRFNARATILYLAGERRNTAPKYDYLSPPRERRYAVSEHEAWWRELSRPVPPTS